MHLNGVLVNLACIMIRTHDEDMECNDVPSLGFNSRQSVQFEGGEADWKGMSVLME